MKVHRHKGKTEEEWREFLDRTNGSLRISHHCLERVAKRFPELLDMTQNDFISLVKSGKICFGIESKRRQFQGAIIRNDKFGFIISFRDCVILTIFKFRKQSAKKVTLNPKGGERNKKTAYYRPQAKRMANKIIKEGLSA